MNGAHYHPDDFCLTHGYEFMRKQFGNPIAYCAACEADAAEIEAMAEKIYMDKYGKISGRWECVETKDVWREKAREHLRALTSQESR